MSQLKKYKGGHELAVPTTLPHMDKKGLLDVEPVAILDRKIVKKKNVVAIYGLVQWANGEPQDATWELLEDLYKRFPGFDS